ncbi:MAG: hypothetical protein D9V44_00810 [Actinobacteria bacterium]|nr:MAG: hypothetical protein D9V44_00810 [Actinomycetota bacterium]
MGSEPTIGSFDRSGQLRTRDDVLRDAVQGMRDEQLRTGRQIVASIDSANAALSSSLTEQTRMLGALGDNLRGVGDEILHLRYSLERGMDALHRQAHLQTALLSVIAQATLAPSRTKAQEFERRAFSLLQRGLLAEARAEAGRSLEEEPYQWGAHHLLAQVSEAESAPDEAVEHYKLAIRYAAGVSPQQQALSLAALARMSLLAGSATDAEQFAWEAYQANPTAELLYASAVYLATTDDTASDAGVQERLYRAVIERPGLSVVAMAEPHLIARSDARDAALSDVRDLMANRVSYALSCLDQVLSSLDGFLRHHRSQSPAEIRTYIRASVVAAIGDQGTAPLYVNHADRIASELLELRDRFAGQGAADIIEGIRADRTTTSRALDERTIESLQTVHASFPQMLDRAESDLKKMAQAIEKATGTITNHALGNERFVEAKRAIINKFGISADERQRFMRAAASAPAERAAVAYLAPIRKYYWDTAKYVEAARPDITRALH